MGKEINAGWVSPFHGTIEEAQSFVQHGLAIGKLGVAVSDSEPLRLVLDPTVCGVNPQSNPREGFSADSQRCSTFLSTFGNPIDRSLRCEEGPEADGRAPSVSGLSLFPSQGSTITILL